MTLSVPLSTGLLPDPTRHARGAHTPEWEANLHIFLTGGTGFVGSHLLPELVGAGHRVSALTRSEEGAVRLTRAGAEAVRGDIGDLNGLRTAADRAEGVIHAAFNHDFGDLQRHSEADRVAIEALGAALAGSDRPLLVTSGTGLVRRQGDRPAVEADAPMSAAEFPRGATEEAADAIAAKGGRVVVVRLPQVHDARHQGRIAQHIKLAREKGRVAYVGEGGNRLAAVHVSDAVRLFRLALEHGEAGVRYHAVAEEGVTLRAIADAIGAGLAVPVDSITTEEAPGYFGWLAGLAQADLAASGTQTQRTLGWHPVGPDLLTDLRAMDYAVV